MTVNSISFNRYFALILPLTAGLGLPTERLFASSEAEGSQLQWLGQRIFMNECAGQQRCLLSWNEGEDFPSLGIGHFIWFPAQSDAPFSETFPALIEHFQSAGVDMPDWLTPTSDAPWQSREQFLAERESQRSQQLLQLMNSTRSLQAEFIARRLHEELPALRQQALADNLDLGRIDANFSAMVDFNPPQGLFALIDYLHFKGSGSNTRERYQGEGWGLLQVLAKMQSNSSTLEAFIASARARLDERVNNAPPERREQRWLRGWHNRIDGYRNQPPSNLARDLR